MYRRSRRHRFLLLLLVLTSVTAITLDYRDQGEGAMETLRQGARDLVAPLQSAAGDALEPVGDFFGGITRYNSLQSENARLRQDLERSRGALLSAQGAERERQALLELQRLDFAANIPSVSARVISTSPSNFQNTVVIDRGSEHRLVVGQPVVTGAGLVGRVLEVSQNRATVQLLTDRAADVGVRLTGSGEIGVANGNGTREPLKVEFVAGTAKVAEGEAVVTSGLERSAYPPEIPVGKVVSARTPPGGVAKEISVEPAVDLRRLEFVKILLWGAGQP
ncbi:MAG: rod shape-determining protein MreC [Actinobacteria bacterium]|nr:rod shape-determining protein MreC [Actinomycetota bacterium]